MNEPKGRNIKKDINLLCHIGEHLVYRAALLVVEIADLIQTGQKTISTNRTHEEATKGRFAFYDALLIIILHLWPSYGKKIFSRLFAKVETKLILKFLDEKTTIFEDTKIFSRLPIGIFLRALALHFIKSKAFRPFVIVCFVSVLFSLSNFPVSLI